MIREELDANYSEACKAAASDQGLDPITARLTAEGIAHEVEQTGGFVMLIRIPLAGTAWLGVANDDPDTDGWQVVVYADDEDEGTLLTNDDQRAPRHDDGIEPDTAVALIRSYLDNPALVPPPADRQSHARRTPHLGL